MSDAGKSQEPSMEEILASIRRIIAEDEAGRSRSGPAPRSTDAASRAPRPMAPTQRAPQGAETGDMVLDLTNLVAADGSVVALAPNASPNSRPVQPKGFAAPLPEQPAAYSGFSRRAPPPGPGAEPRMPGFAAPPAAPPAPQPMGFASGFAATPDTPSRSPAPEAQPGAMPMPLPPNLSEDSPSRRVFKRRHTAGTAFAELAQSGYVPPSSGHPNSGFASPPQGFGEVPAGSVATELDMSQPAHPPSGSPTGFAADAFAAPSSHPNSGFAVQPAHPNSGFAAPSAHPNSGFAAPQPSYAPPPAFAPPAAPAAYAPPAAPQYVAPPPPAISEEQIQAAVSMAAEPAIRSWLDANLQAVIEQQIGTLVQQHVEQALAATLTQTIDQRIHDNVQANLAPYIEDRVGAHVEARLASAVEEKVGAAVKQQVALEVNGQIGEAVRQQVAAAVTEQLEGQQQSMARLVDDRVKSEIRALFARLAGN